ncbi:LysR family transcriptional regulator substrate-binding protein [Nocardioides daeguensis]|uniref:LysR substrate-binding domain-containing protein n=1 Tax=Nocardioides daeguensis TaxID=908359 RepID=A0ABP6W1B6_9ACTN|nr:LysR family transcriptional regulator substrate-binding protein [Nocardioides daeguensis]MBV6726647.1 LysR family transcriptional regulator substrate-binding protein [Nocardioides daeguensis]MCR1774601.1 LysR family transcriptional regulator substrate-binding protein [Nocardioides daeguensis]
MQDLRIAFVPGVTPDKWARAWRERNPRIRLHLLPVEEEQQRAVLDDGTADMALVRLPVDLESPAPLHCVRLYDEVPVVVAGREHFVAASDPETPIPMADLAEEQLVLPHPSGWTPTAEQLPFPPMNVKDAIEVAASGSGIVIVPMSVARLHHRKDVVQRPVELDPTTVALVWLRAADSPVHQDFVGVVRGRRASSSR